MYRGEWMITYNEECLLIENYVEVLSVKKNELMIRCKTYKMMIFGTNLLISALSKDEIVIKGRVEVVKFSYES